jgi:hypothetical protein
MSDLPTPPGYSRLEPLDTTAHGGRGVCAERALTFGAGLNAAYLAATEFFRALRHLPIAFARDGRDGAPVPVAVLGLAEGENLLVDRDGRWDPAVYRPAYLRAWPFYTLDLGGGEDGKEPRSLVCVDPEGLCPDAPALFDGEGKATPAWEDQRRFLQDMDTARRQTARLSQRLAELDLLEPFEAHAYAAGGGSRRLGGLLRVGESRLNALSGETVSGLMKDGMLSRIYGHLISLENFAGLLDRAQGRARGEGA